MANVKWQYSLRRRVNAAMKRRLSDGLAAVFVALTVVGAFAQTNVPAGLPAVDAAIEKAVADGLIPGAVCVIAHNGKIIHRRAYGNRSLEPDRAPMMVNTIFDIASLTKSIATATSIMQLVEEGKVRLNDPVVKYIPEFGQNGKGDVTVRQLLTHYSGLREDLDQKEPWSGKAEGWRRADEEKLVAPPGAMFRYSDINFILLGEIVERVSEMPLDQYAEAHIFQPLNMTSTRFLPPESWRARIAPTEYDENHVMLRGIVHDPTSRRMGGVAGHAGLFSSADDLALFAQNLLSGTRILSRLTIEKMTTPQQPPWATSLRGLGWDIDSPFSSNRGELFPVGSFGHTGFTGTSLWIDPYTQTYVVLLTNAVHPHVGKSVVSLRSRVATAVAAALHQGLREGDMQRLLTITGYNEQAAGLRRPIARNGSVRTGIDVLEASNFSQLLALRSNSDGQANSGNPMNIGLLTNQNGVDSNGRRDIDVLAGAPGIKLAALFSPEHGVQGVLDTSAIDNAIDPATGTPIYSVYGDTNPKRHPPLDVLRKLDAVVVDLQDAGVRFWTYGTSMAYFLEGAAQAGIPIVVLDRPNPINGAVVQGPVSDPGLSSFVNYSSTLPVRHGMTMGELARMYNGERNINARLTVVPVEGLIAGDWYDATGLMWIDPSPNLRSLTQNTLYPGVALVEGTNISVGRGTDAPFEFVGAPWIQPRDLARELNSRMISGVRFVPVNFTPTSSVYSGMQCGGVRIALLDRNALDSPELGVELAAALHKLYPADWKVERMKNLLLNQASYDALIAGEDPRRIADDWRDDLEKFRKVRAKYLMYEKPAEGK